MKTISEYFEKIKAWSKVHPIRASFALGFIVGFLVKGVVF